MRQKWINEAIDNKEKLEVIKAIPMRGLLVKSTIGNEFIFNGSDLKVVQNVSFINKED